MSLFFLSLSFWLILRSVETRRAHFPARASKTLLRRHFVPSPPWGGTWCIVSDASPVSRALLVLCVNQGISASFSLLLSYRWLRTTRFRSIKGPQQSRIVFFCYNIFFQILNFLLFIVEVHISNAYFISSGLFLVWFCSKDLFVYNLWSLRN